MAAGRTNTRTYTREQYNGRVEGNTVRKQAAQPERMPREERVRIRERQQASHRNTRRQEQQASVMSPGYVVFLTAAVILTVCVCAVFIQLQSEISTRTDSVASLENQIQDLKTDNDAALSRIETSINLDEIRTAATEQLGMVYPGKDQIVYYEVETNDYMNQYQEIPEE